MSGGPVYESDTLITNRARAIQDLERDIDLLHDFIRMLTVRGCSAAMRKGLRKMDEDWSIQLDMMRTHQESVTPASQKPAEKRCGSMAPVCNAPAMWGSDYCRYHRAY
jgi:hypothetical protein